MAEKIRLVVWDLDQSFWRGTLTEGGINYSRANHDAVVALARRGIMSSICSKNDPAQVEAILSEHGIWDYFIFPSVSWEPKGPRLAALVAAAQLRPETVLFIDDNWLNRQEALHFVPGIQVADETCLTDLLDNPLLQGKDDRELTRLAQYRLLARRQRDQREQTGDVQAFLRGSGIRVRVEHDVEAHLDRAVELINRTNQLNFTKRRLPEDAEAARAQLMQLLGDYNVQAGLIHVQDDYGDYGFCGLYALRSFGSETALEHFCFSCRILNMGVEEWVYHQLGRPALKVVGEVLTEINTSAHPPDWINQAGRPGAVGADAPVPVREIIARGGCNIASLMHYFQVAGIPVRSELNIARHGVDIRRDHTIFLRYGLQGLNETDRRELELMGFAPEDYLTALLGPQQRNAVWLFSFWADADFALYRNRTTGLRIPVSLFFPGRPNDATRITVEQLPRHLQTPPVIAMVERLASDYVHEGLIPEAMFKENLRLVLNRAPADALVFILGNNEVQADPEGRAQPMFWKAEANQRTREVVAEYCNVEWIDTAAFMDAHVIGDPNHLNRLVYHRIFQHIAAVTAQRRAPVLEPSK